VPELVAVELLVAELDFVVDAERLARGDTVPLTCAPEDAVAAGGEGVDERVAVAVAEADAVELPVAVLDLVDDGDGNARGVIVPCGPSIALPFT